MFIRGKLLKGSLHNSYILIPILFFHVVHNSQDCHVFPNRSCKDVIRVEEQKCQKMKLNYSTERHHTILFVDIGSHVSQTGLQRLCSQRWHWIPHPPKCWEYRYIPLCPATTELPSILRGRDENKVIIEGVELKDFPVMGLWFPILESEPKASGAL